MIKIDKKFLSIALTIFIILVFLWYFFSNIEDFKQLSTINPIYVILLMLIDIAFIVLNGIFMRLAVLLFGKKINITESVRVSLISTAGNFFATAGSGLGLRAIYLKKRHGLAYSDYMSILLCNYIILFFVCSVLGLLALFSVKENISENSMVLAVFMLSLLSISFLSLFIRMKPSDEKIQEKGAKWVNTLLEIMRRVSDGWRLILQNKKIMLGLVAIVLSNTTLAIIGSYLVLGSINITIPFSSLVLFSVLGLLSIFINITPGNLGIKEAIYIAFSATIGLTTSEILSVALIDRAVLFFVIIVLWLAFGRNNNLKY